MLWTVFAGTAAAALRVAQKPVATAREEAFVALAACPGQPAWLAVTSTGKLMSMRWQRGHVEHEIIDAQVYIHVVCWGFVFFLGGVAVPTTSCRQVPGARCLAMSGDAVTVGGAQGLVRLFTHSLVAKVRLYLWQNQHPGSRLLRSTIQCVSQRTSLRAIRQLCRWDIHMRMGYTYGHSWYRGHCQSQWSSLCKRRQWC